VARLIRTEKEVEGRFEDVWLVVDEDPLEQWPAGARTIVGQEAERVDAPQRIRGEARYTADLQFPGMLHAAILRSPHAHARLGRITTSAASKLPGVVRILTGADVDGKIGNVACAAALEGLRIPPHPVLAKGKVRFVGEPVAVVVADDPYKAYDAIEQIDVLAGEHRMDAREPLGARGVDGDDPRVRLRGADEGRPQLARDVEVVDVARAAHDEPRVLLALDRLSDPLAGRRVLHGGHAPSPWLATASPD